MDKELRVSRPCSRRWDDLIGDDVRRFCSDCNKFVHNLDAIAPTEVEALRHAGGFCGTYLADASGSSANLKASPPMKGRQSSAAAATILVSVLAGCAPPQKEPNLPDAPAAPSQIGSTSENSPPSPPEGESTLLVERKREVSTERLQEELRMLGYMRD